MSSTESPPAQSHHRKDALLAALFSSIGVDRIHAIEVKGASAALDDLSASWKARANIKDKGEAGPDRFVLGRRVSADDIARDDLKRLFARAAASRKAKRKHYSSKDITSKDLLDAASQLQPERPAVLYASYDATRMKNATENKEEYTGQKWEKAVKIIRRARDTYRKDEAALARFKHNAADVLQKHIAAMVEANDADGIMSVTRAFASLADGTKTLHPNDLLAMNPKNHKQKKLWELIDTRLSQTPFWRLTVRKFQKILPNDWLMIAKASGTDKSHIQNLPKVSQRVVDHMTKTVSGGNYQTTGKKLEQAVALGFDREWIIQQAGLRKRVVQSLERDYDRGTIEIPDTTRTFIVASLRIPWGDFVASSHLQKIATQKLVQSRKRGGDITSERRRYASALRVLEENL